MADHPLACSRPTSNNRCETCCLLAGGAFRAEDSFIHSLRANPPLGGPFMPSSLAAGTTSVELHRHPLSVNERLDVLSYLRRQQVTAEIERAKRCIAVSRRQARERERAVA